MYRLMFTLVLQRFDAEAVHRLTIRALQAISARPFAPSFDLMFDTCTLAVFSLMNRSVAISRFVRPSVRRSSTSCSRRVSLNGIP